MVCNNPTILITNNLKRAIRLNRWLRTSQRASDRNSIEWEAVIVIL